ncbi:CHASE2 domain-containing protein [Candidatus Poribacteria bacterium]|jgi:signal transduction histidine kinase|nr:CHASE2 domain-containing protein [Candidatus Poribacteria bacterium]MBT5531422.1 CHASE2 domain-containing protein [Candidatus Poribacteria bacterium]MBT5712804.1 CHASE2 domain-containing protein [Candidatus Poribacteria bacterium]MBT7807754.1 CHASE2 domain-containing protein [Candidatus Poribacteria bacterium]
MARKVDTRARILRWVLICFAATLVAEWYGLFDLLELKTYDSRARTRGSAGGEASPLLALVPYDEAAEEILGPYPPDAHAALLGKLRDAGCLGVFLALRFQTDDDDAIPWPDVGIPVYVIRPYTRVHEAGRTGVPWVGGAATLPGYVSGAKPIVSFSRLVASASDGFYRRSQAHVAYGFARDPQHSLEVQFAAAALGVDADTIPLPTDARGAVMIPALPDGLPVVSAYDVMVGAPTALQGRWAVVGFDGTQDAARMRTPFGPSTAYQARAAVVNGILTSGLTPPRGRLATAILFLAWAGVFVAVGFAFRARVSGTGTLALSVAAAVTGHVCLAYALIPTVWLPIVSPIVGMVLTGVAWVLSMNGARATLAERRAMQAEREAAFGVMSAQVRHEVRNLLNSVRAPAEMVRNNFSRGDPLGLAEDHDELVTEMDVVISRVTQLSDMVENELTYFHPNTFQLQPADLWDIAMDARDTLADDLREAKITVTADAAPGRPTVMADPPKMRVAFVNLIRNAIQAMPDGGALSIEFGAVTAPQPGVHVRVTDTGIGIDSERVAQLFEPFHTTKARGLGLGLFNVNHIVRTHSGEIRAHGAPGQGATFEVFIPVAAGVTP